MSCSQRSFISASCKVNRGILLVFYLLVAPALPLSLSESASKFVLSQAALVSLEKAERSGRSLSPTVSANCFNFLSMGGSHTFCFPVEEWIS